MWQEVLRAQMRATSIISWDVVPEVFTFSMFGFTREPCLLCYAFVYEADLAEAFVHEHGILTWRFSLPFGLDFWSLCGGLVMGICSIVISYLRPQVRIFQECSEVEGLIQFQGDGDPTTVLLDEAWVWTKRNA